MGEKTGKGLGVRKVFNQANSPGGVQKGKGGPISAKTPSGEVGRTDRKEIPEGILILAPIGQPVGGARRKTSTRQEKFHERKERGHSSLKD